MKKRPCLQANTAIAIYNCIAVFGLGGLSLLVFAELGVERGLAGAQVGVVEEIPGQRTGIVVGQGMDAEQTAQVDIDSRCHDLLEVEVKIIHGEGIDGRVIIDQVGPPRLNHRPQLPMILLTEQGRQRRVSAETDRDGLRLTGDGSL